MRAIPYPPIQTETETRVGRYESMKARSPRFVSLALWPPRFWKIVFDCTRQILGKSLPLRSKEAGHDVEPLPEPTHMEMVMGALLIRLETRFPGISQEMLEQVESDVNRVAVRRLRARAPPASVYRALDFASRWMAGAALFADSQLGPVASRLKRKKGR